MSAVPERCTSVDTLPSRSHVSSTGHERIASLDHRERQPGTHEVPNGHGRSTPNPNTTPTPTTARPTTSARTRTPTRSGAAAPVTLRDTVAVVGDGAVGLSAVLASKRLGAERIIASSISAGAATLGQLRIDVDPDSQVPVAVELGAKGEHAVDNEDTVVRHRHARPRVVDLRDGVDAAQRNETGAGWVCRVEEEVADSIEVEGVPVVALA
jgi:hypothetical protein